MNIEDYQTICAEFIGAELRIEFGKLVKELKKKYPVLEGIFVNEFFIQLKPINN